MPPPIHDRQLALFVRRAVIEMPSSGVTADSWGMVEADDGALYHVKGDANGVPTRASEWLASHIAEAVGIQTPMVAPIEMSDGSTTFGSRRISGTADDTATAAYLLTPSQANFQAPVRGLGPLLSAIYAFDMFIHNVDRHLGNYLSVEEHGVRRLFAFDFSRALFCNWPWQGFPPLGCHTRTLGAMLRQLHGFDLAVATSTLDRLGDVAPAFVEEFLRRMPADWLPPAMGSQFMRWWAGSGRSDRLDELRKGFGNGASL
jgi:hypothetical protein